MLWGRQNFYPMGDGCLRAGMSGPQTLSNGPDFLDERLSCNPVRHCPIHDT